MNFGSIVVTLRKEQGISQADLADKLIIHKNVYSRYERNEVVTSVEIAHNIADILDVSLDYLKVKQTKKWTKTLKKES